MPLTATEASWKVPRHLLKYLLIWAARSDTKPDRKARAAADDALNAIDAMTAELAALRARLVREMDLDDVVDAEIVELPAADPGSAETRLLRAVHGLCPDCDRTDEHSHEGQDGLRVSYPTHALAPVVSGDEVDDDLPAGLMACGDSVIVEAGRPEPGTPAVCERHGATQFLTLAEWMDVVMPASGFGALGRDSWWAGVGEAQTASRQTPAGEMVLCEHPDHPAGAHTLRGKPPYGDYGTDPAACVYPHNAGHPAAGAV